MLTCPKPLVLTLFWNIWWIAAEFLKPFWGISQKKKHKEKKKKVLQFYLGLSCCPG